MKKIIKNKVYDTATAQYIGAYLGDWEDASRWRREELYKKRTGEYFLYSEGHETPETITPLSFDEAKEWGRKHLEGVEYEIEFEVAADDNAVTRLHVEIPASLNDRLELERSKIGASKAEVVIEALENYLQNF